MKALSILSQAIKFLTIFAGACTVFIILASVLQIMIGDEGETKRYLTRIKHSIIAFILIITISNIQNLITGYFPYQQSNSTIGDFRKYSNIYIRWANRIQIQGCSK